MTCTFSELKILTAASLLAALSLAGCVQTQAPLAPSANQHQTPMQQWQQHQAQLAAITHFTAQGKLAFISPKERISAHFNWEQQGEKMTLRVTNFLGARLFNLVVTPTKTELIDNKDRRYTHHDASALLTKLTGIALPLEQMVGWLKGQVSPSNSYQLGENGRLASLSEFKTPKLKTPNAAGWQIQYQSYDSATANLLPAKLSMQLGAQKVNLAISQWTY